MDKGIAWSLLCIFLIHLQPKWIEAYSDSQSRLYTKLFGNNISRRIFLPRNTTKKPVYVTLKFELINIKEVNAKEQFISNYGWMTQLWDNPFMTWNSSEFDGIDSLSLDSTAIWVPDILLYDNVDAQDHTGGGRTTYTTDVTLFSSGLTRWKSPALFKSVCNINVTKFPFDEQVCLLKFGSWSHDSSYLSMLAFEADAKAANYVDNGEWELVSAKYVRSTVNYGGVNYDDVTIRIHIGRNYFNYVVNLIIPCALISCVIFLGFVLPPESGERIGLSITVLLAMTVFQQLSSQIFPSFDFPLLAQYYFAASLEVSLALGASALVINMSFRKTTRMPRYLRKMLLVWLAKVVFLRNEVERSRPKRPDGSIITGDASCERERESTYRKEDRLTQELKEVINNPSHNFDYGGTHFIKTRSVANGSFINGSSNDVALARATAPTLVYTDPPKPHEAADSPKMVQQTHVLGEDGKVLGDDEVAVREWEWKQATRVLDRVFLWTSVLIGVVTILAMFVKKLIA